MCWTPLNTRRRKTNKNTTQYVLDTTKHKTKKNKQIHNTICVGHHYTQDEEKQTKTQHNMCWTPLNTRRRKTKQNKNTICVGHHYTHTNTNNVNKT
jgi:quinolinate synthase